MSILSDELTNDPLGRNYTGMTDEQAAADLNTVYRSRNRTSMTGDEIFQATDAAQWGALTNSEKTQWLAFCGRQEVAPFGPANVAFVQSLIGGQTTINLAALRVEPISRAEELSIPVTTGYVQASRN